ncbi:MAG: hypothetical protein AAFW97_13140 [Pseudomonadota bacterium]
MVNLSVQMPLPVIGFAHVPLVGLWLAWWRKLCPPLAFVEGSGLHGLFVKG